MAIAQRQYLASPGEAIWTLDGVEIQGALQDGCDRVLTPDAIAFAAGLHRIFHPKILALLNRRREIHILYYAGHRPAFLSDGMGIREGDWTIGKIPADLQERRVEITGPPDRKMVINALNSGANVFMADFEDSLTPTWHRIMEGQRNLMDAVRREIDYRDPKSGKTYSLNSDTAVLMARPRGWHLPENHVLVDEVPISAAIFDFALYFYHNARKLIEQGSGPYFYLPKLENHYEARLWNDVFIEAERELGLPVGTIKATVLIETLPAAFEMEEIIFELREHIAGLNCGRWDYIFSFIKKFHVHPEFVLPDRSSITMDRHFLRSYSLLLIQTCHRRGLHAIGGMAAQIPIKNDPGAGAAALRLVRRDKMREATDGHDGTWVAHPALVPIAKEVFDQVMPGPNQISNLRQDVEIGPEDLLDIPGGEITETGLRQNINVALLYMESWLRGQGCVPLHNLMEDAATAEISRAQVWQWLHHGAALADGRTVDRELVCTMIRDELNAQCRAADPRRLRCGRYDEAADLLREVILAEYFTEFLTAPAYEKILSYGH